VSAGRIPGEFIHAAVVQKKTDVPIQMYIRIRANFTHIFKELRKYSKLRFRRIAFET
jgi:hypothetical protein